MANCTVAASCWRRCRWSMSCCSAYWIRNAASARLRRVTSLAMSATATVATTPHQMTAPRAPPGTWTAATTVAAAMTRVGSHHVHSGADR
ncbi:hypothetical protein ACWV95_07700 [Streptomyces albus]